MPYTVDFTALAAVFKNNGQRSTVKEEDFTGLKDLVHDFSPQAFRVYIKESFESLFGVSLLESLPTDQEVVQSQLLCARKYRQPLWTAGNLRTEHLYNNGI